MKSLRAHEQRARELNDALIVARTAGDRQVHLLEARMAALDGEHEEMRQLVRVVRADSYVYPVLGGGAWW